MKVAKKKTKAKIALKKPTSDKESRPLNRANLSGSVRPQYADLRAVMDYTVPFELIYSGVENEVYYDILYDMGIRNFLMSYHYLQTKHELNLNRRFAGQDDVRLFIDSGAHTYQNDPKYAEYTVEYWEQHLQKYLEWAERNRNHIFAIANFDFENIVGPAVVSRWNKYYFEPFMLETGIPVCFVWHQNSNHSWQYYCKRYPYVGFSSVNTEGVAIELDEYRDRLRTAEKYDALVHGFGMTRTGMLTQLPFYTSDSTTWLVGLQYGEINYWRDTHMSRLKKDLWKTPQYLEEICARYNLQSDLLADEDTSEMVRANVGAFMDAEKFIQTRLVSRMYWMRPRAHRNDLDDETIYPPPDVLGDANAPLVEYAEGMNINPNAADVEAIVFIATILLARNIPEYSDYSEAIYEKSNIKVMSELHDRFINRVTPDDDAMIEDLEEFFAECVSGENDTLLTLDTNFDRYVREREDYIEDDEEYDGVEISADEVRAKLQNLLPSPSDGGAKEITELDSEIFEQAKIVPTWGEDGKLLKGQQLVRKPKQVYSQKYPKFACDTCYAAQRCKEYKPGHVCAFQKMFQRFDTRNQSDIILAMQGIVNHNMARMQKAMVMETINGVIDPVVSQLMDINIKYMNMLNSLYETASPAILQQTRVVRADGTVEESTSIHANPQGGGIMEKLFASMMNGPQQEDEEVIDVTPKEKNERYNTIEDEM